MLHQKLATATVLIGMWLMGIATASADDLVLQNNVFEGTLTQGAQYTIQGATTSPNWYIDPDFFTPNTDGSLTFNAITGTYTIVANTAYNYYQVYAGTQAQPATLNTDDGTGAIWLIGSTGVGKPTFTATGANWNTGVAHDFCLAQIEPGVHRITLEVGKQLNASDVNFKFFGQPAWGAEFKGTPNVCSLASVSDIFGVGTGSSGHDDGNIYLLDGASVAIGDVCVFTVDCRTGLANATLTVDVTRTATTLHPVFAGESMSPIGIDFIWRGELTQDQCYVASGEEAMNADDWYINDDYFERQSDGSLRFLPLSGSYAVRADFQKRWFNVYPIDESGNPLTMNPDGTGAVYAIGMCGKPAHHYNDGESWKGDIEHAMAMAPIAEKVYQLTLTVGREIPIADPELKFYCQPGWGKEFNPAASDQYDIYTDLNYQFVVGSSDGNVNADPEAIWAEGDVYKFTLDCTDMTRAHLIVTGGQAISGMKHVQTSPSDDGCWYNLSGQRLGQLNPHGVNICGGQKIIVPRL